MFTALPLFSICAKYIFSAWSSLALQEYSNSDIKYVKGTCQCRGHSPRWKKNYENFFFLLFKPKLLFDTTGVFFFSFGTVTATNKQAVQN